MTAGRRPSAPASWFVGRRRRIAARVDDQLLVDQLLHGGGNVEIDRHAELGRQPLLGTAVELLLA